MSPARARLLVHPFDGDFQARGQFSRRENVLRLERVRRVHLHKPCTPAPKSLIPKTQNVNSGYPIGTSLPLPSRAFRPAVVLHAGIVLMPARRVPFAGLAVLGGSLALVEGLYFIDQDGSLAIEPVDGEPPANSHQVSGPESREFLRAFREAEKQDCAVRFVELQRSTRTLSSISLAACVDFARDGAAQFDFIHVSLPASLDLQPSNPLGPVPRGN